MALPGCIFQTYNFGKSKAHFIGLESIIVVSVSHQAEMLAFVKSHKRLFLVKLDAIRLFLHFL